MKRTTRARSLVAAVALAGSLSAFVSPCAAQDTRLLVVVGLGGDQEHRERFHGWATELIEAARTRYGVPEANIRYLGEDPEADPALIQGRSTAENVQAAIREIAAGSTPDDAVVIVLIGHGSARGSEARFNLPGPDLGPAELALLLDQLPTSRIAVVNTTASSGGFLPALAGEGRVIIAATRGPREQNETLFGGYFVQAFDGEDADLDKDGRVSLLEAFQYAAREVQRHYDDEGLLLTEHAVLDDDGDGVGSSEPAPPEGEGRVAATLFLAPARPRGADAVAATPELEALYRRRDSLEVRVQELRAVRESLDPSEYDRRLEDLLVELGLTTREIRALEGGGPR